jgi:hypothetical protein
LFFNWRKRSNFQPITEIERTRQDVEDFIRLIETDHTAVRCKCRWRVHPDDVMVKPGYCRVCGDKPVSHRDHEFKGIRRIKVDTHPECPVHTKEGLLLGFLEWSRNE